ncbi:Vacuolar protein sorting-associated protein 35 [Podochytrium sp. JEL0797]|nr:Vacuolar protein sorting-associated protein 35 [Podochytrium sp. JEL0797]
MNNSAPEQQKLVDEALAVVKTQCVQMRRCLDNHRLMDALKHSSAMLAELKTSTLHPKGYYELYMAIFDQLRHLAAYLYDSHMHGRHHLSDLYELVQYAGSIVPRLYLMITVGSVFMRVTAEMKAQQPAPSVKGKERAGSTDPSAAAATATPVNPIHDVPPLKELLKDMLDMALGVQHPVRGLFLRYYLTSMCRDYMPDGDVDSKFGCRMDSIQFLLQDFVEKNKLWVRLQYIGHSREREQREMERRELKLLVGSNLLRLSQIEGLNPEVFANLILPSIMSEVVNCRDVMAQEYLMEVVIQVFPDEFHLHSLDIFLSATSQLSRNVNVKQTVLSLVNRFTAFARKNREDHAVKAKASAAAKGDAPSKPAPISGIPGDILVFEIFWEQVTQHIAVRTEFQLHDVVSLLSCLVELSTGCYPLRYDYVDLVLGYAVERVREVVVNKQPAMTSPETTTSLLHLLQTTLNAYKTNPLAFLSFPSSSLNPAASVSTPATLQQQFTGLVMGAGSSMSSSNSRPMSPNPPAPAPTATAVCGHFTALLNLQPYSTRKQIAMQFVDMCVAASDPLSKLAPRFRIKSVAGVEAVFGEVCDAIVRDALDGGLLAGVKVVRSETSPERRVGTVVEVVGAGEGVGVESVRGECVAVGKLVGLVAGGAGADDDLELLAATRKFVSLGGPVRLKYAIPPLIYSCARITRDYLGSTDLSDVTIPLRLNTLFQFCNESIQLLQQSGHLQDAVRTTKTMGGGKVDKEAEVWMKVQPSVADTAEVCLRMYLCVAGMAREARNAEACYEALVEALTTYEDGVVDTKVQVYALCAVMQCVRACAGSVGVVGYETVAGKCGTHCGRLLRKVDQVKGYLCAAFMYWGEEVGEGDGVRGGWGWGSWFLCSVYALWGVFIARASGSGGREKRSQLKGMFGEEEEEEKVAVVEVGRKVWRDGKKVLECLQKALKIADSVLETGVSTELFVEILESYVWFYEDGNEYIGVHFLNSLMQAIQSNIDNTTAAMTTAAVVPDNVVRHFVNIVSRLRVLKEAEAEERRERGLDMTNEDVFGGDSEQGFGGVSRAGGRWTGLGV